MSKDASEPGVAAVNRALTILQAFENSVEGMTLTDLMNATGLYHSTILRLCESLERFRYLKRLEDGRYMLGSAPFVLGMIYQASFHLRDYALPVLRALTRETLETAALYVRDGDARVCLHRVELPRRVRTNVPEGDRVELDKGAAGRVLLAYAGESGKAFDDVRHCAHAVSLAERDSESAAIAAPVFGARQQIVGAVSLGIPLYRFDRKKYESCLPAVMAAARQLGFDLGGDVAALEPPWRHVRSPKIPA